MLKIYGLLFIISYARFCFGTKTLFLTVEYHLPPASVINEQNISARCSGLLDKDDTLFWSITGGTGDVGYQYNPGDPNVLVEKDDNTSVSVLTVSIVPDLQGATIACFLDYVPNHLTCLDNNDACEHSLSLHVVYLHERPKLTLNVSTFLNENDTLQASCFAYVGTWGNMRWALAIADNLFRLEPDDKRVQKVNGKPKLDAKHTMDDRHVWSTLTLRVTRSYDGARIYCVTFHNDTPVNGKPRALGGADGLYTQSEPLTVTVTLSPSSPVANDSSLPHDEEHANKGKPMNLLLQPKTDTVTLEYKYVVLLIVGSGVLAVILTNVGSGLCGESNAAKMKIDKHAVPTMGLKRDMPEGQKNNKFSEIPTIEISVPTDEETNGNTCTSVTDLRHSVVVESEKPDISHHSGSREYSPDHFD